MYLDAVRERGEVETRDFVSSQAYARWQNFPISQLSHHGASCCEIARQWIVAMDRAQLGGGDLLSGPRWLRARYEWGPSPWPMHWCELVERKVIDCGAHSALAHEALAGRGVTAFRAQFVQTYGADAQAQWRAKWASEQVSDHWIAGDVIYHEGNAVLVGKDEIKLWDASAACWLNPSQTSGYGSLAAVRLWTDQPVAARLNWGEHRIRANAWHQFSG
jgi:hypothetical protein